MTFVSGRYDIDVEDIKTMAIADGLKEVLISRGLTRNQILTLTTEELASILDIDKYVAYIIRNAATKSPKPI
jgi:hypothetical protein